jgi:exonuclease VII large subunit
VTGRLSLLRPRVDREEAALHRCMAAVLDRARRAVEAQSRQLEALSHARVLERGYAIVRGRAGGHVIPRLSAVGVESDLDIVFADGTLPVRRADRGRSARSSESRQGNLL